mmetsp:Transcript_43046/g.102418  ORF Transcript_43046/g.102418 Transcript_43046/m.102418 type:complete len:394 (-) Transcript_43046:136-1317(-)
MPVVWIDRIWTRPASLGSPISTCTSRRPGRRRASSSMSFRFVIPMMRMLFNASTPSMNDSSWFTTLSPTPVSPRVVPLCRQMASTSSRMITCSSDSSPFSSISALASAKRLRMFSSEPPTYLLKISGPFTTLGSRSTSILPILRAMRVLPHPGAPKRSTPRTCISPILASTEEGYTRDANARRKMSPSSVSRPPMPILEKAKSGRNILPVVVDFWTLVRFTVDPLPFVMITRLVAQSLPSGETLTSSSLSAEGSAGSAGPLATSRSVTRRVSEFPWKSTRMSCVKERTCPLKKMAQCLASSIASIGSLVARALEGKSASIAIFEMWMCSFGKYQASTDNGSLRDSASVLRCTKLKAKEPSVHPGSLRTEKIMFLILTRPPSEMPSFAISPFVV